MLIISGISVAAVGLYTRRFTGRVRAATPFIIIMFCAAGWSLVYALDLMTTDLSLRVFFHNLRFLFLPYFSVLELWLVLEYVNKTEWILMDLAAIALIVPVTSTILGLTSQYHTLFRYNFSISTAGPVPVLQYSESAFFTFYSYYGLALLALAILVLITESRKRGTLWNMSTVLLIAALALPTVLNYLSQIFQFPFPGINLAPILLWVAAILYAIALFRYRFLDIVPIARSRLIETLKEPVLVLDTDERIIDMNPAASSLFAQEQSAAIGIPVGEIAPDWPEFIALCRERTTRKCDLVLVRGGQRRYYSGSLELLLTPAGETEGYLVILHDVTDLKNAENAFRESEEKYRNIIEDMQDLFYRTDLAGKITMLSPSAAKIAGYDSVDELIGRDVTAVYADPHERERFLDALHKTGAVDAYPLNLRTRDGMIRNVTTSSHFYRDAQGNVLGVEGVIHDMTEQRKAENALRMANKKLNLLSSITRHDIRNQLMALMAFLELSQESLNNPEELAEFLKKNLNIADTIASQIMFTKEYEDLGVKEPSWQNVGAGVEKAAAGLPVRNIRIRNDTAGLEVFADPLVERVFYNLIDNALRYGGGQMTTIRIHAHPSGQSLVLVFEDDGDGIPEGDKKVIFDKGFGKNTGLGLYLSREILSITGITIVETGIPGKGARFEITVPEGGFRQVS